MQCIFGLSGTTKLELTCFYATKAAFKFATNL